MRTGIAICVLAVLTAGLSWAVLRLRKDVFHREGTHWIVRFGFDILVTLVQFLLLVLWSAWSVEYKTEAWIVLAVGVILLTASLWLWDMFGFPNERVAEAAVSAKYGDRHVYYALRIENNKIAVGTSEGIEYVYLEGTNAGTIGTNLGVLFTYKKATRGRFIIDLA